MPAYKPRTAADIRLRLLDLAAAAGADAYEAVLHTLGAGVRAAAARIEEAERTGRSDYADLVIGDETEIIENLLGAAYVVCQAQITAVVQAALRAREQAVADGLSPSFGPSARDVRALGAPFDPSFSKVEVLWALANYFKHRDEWSRSTWTAPTGPARQTVPVILAAGLQRSSTGNLRQGAEALGNTAYEEMSVFQTIIQDWSETVRQRTRAVFGG